jgi:toxoflavin biosynthesis protein ToxD
MEESNKHPVIPMWFPEPFEWVYIPDGSVTLRYPSYNQIKSDMVNIHAFFMAKYPITNAQFNVYLDDTKRERFRFRDTHPQFSQPLHPVIDLWWHEAMQFCEWLSSKLNYRVTLPTNEQWQRAAQGNDNRKYPWGNTWDSNRCNSAHNTIKYTTPVTQYPQGASFFGVMDMAGNVCEWCLTDAYTGENSLNFQVPEPPSLSGNERIFCGGHYLSSGASANATSMGAISANWYSYSCGIRLVTTVNS